MRKQTLLITLLAFSLTLPAFGAKIAHYTFEEGSGPSVYDMSGNGFDGTVEGADWAEGYFGSGLEFDGSSYVELPGEDMGMTAETGSVAFWVNSGEPSGINTLFWGGDNTTGNGFGGENELHVHLEQAADDVWAGGELALFIYGTGHIASDPDSAIGAAPVNPTQLNDELWHHVACIWDDGDLSMYIDGDYIHGDNFSSVDFDLTYIYLGQMAAGTRYFTGLMDDLQIYNHPLTEVEVQLAMAGGVDPALPSGPSPSHEEEDVALDETLSWTPGIYAASHDVYFGTNLEDVNNADRANPGSVLVSQGQSDTTYTPEEFALDGVYYWRVDEVNQNPSDIHKGPIWTFMAEPSYFAVTPVVVTASSYDEVEGSDYNCPPENTINGSGLTAEGTHSSLVSTLWRTAQGEIVGAWIQYEFEAAYQLHQMHVWNYNGENEGYLGVGVKNALIETSLDGETWTSVGQVQLARATGTRTYAGEEVSLNDTLAKYVRIEVLSQQGFGTTGAPIVQQVGLSEVQFQMIPIAARRPSPADGGTVDSLFDELTWRLGRGAQESRLYVDSVLVDTVTGRRYSIADTGAQYNESYSWRVDQVNGDQVTAGPSWTFNTPEYLTIDDMESYGNREGSRIFDAWQDGYGHDNDNGSIVGYDVDGGPYTENEITFDGSGQSMPFTYEDDASPAWATLDLGGQDWSVGGLETLVIHFLGDEDNDEATFYVEIDGKRIESSKSLTSTIWQQMAIEIGTLGIDLTRVDEFIIGVDGEDAEGMLYIDEIRIYRDVHIVESPVNPQNTGLAVYYNMEDNVDNQAGSQYNGIEDVTLFYSNNSANDDFDKCLIFDGIESEVNIPDMGDLISTLTSSSYSAWVSIDEDATGNWMRVFDFGTGTTNYLFISPRIGTAGEVRGAILSQAMSDASIDEVGVTSAAPLVDGWHHLAMVIEQGDPNGTLTLYVDGWSAGSTETPAMPADLGVTTQNWLGMSQWDGDDFYEGLMDEFRIYNRALSEGEVRYLAGDR